jgi:hypothetical protein
MTIFTVDISLAPMPGSPLSFNYSWSDLQAIRALAVTLVVAQLIGALVGAITRPGTDLIQSLWVCVAFATFPGFGLGLLIQSWVRPGSLGENRTMIRRIGLLAVLFAASSLYVLRFDVRIGFSIGL